MSIATSESIVSANMVDEEYDGDTHEGLQVPLVAALFKRRVGKRNLLLVFRQLALLVETGIDLAEALRLVSDTCRNQVLADCLDEIYEDITNGRSLSAAVASQEEVLGYQVTASIQAGEASGRLSAVLGQIAEQFEQELEMSTTITGALAYPAILSFASIAVASVLVWFVLPQFEKSFASMGVDPPIFTQYLIWVSGLIRSNILVVVGGVLGLAALLFVLSGQASTRRLIGNLCFSSPVLGVALRNMAVGNMFINLGHLLRNGISLLEAIQLTRKSAGSSAIVDMIEVWENDVLEGRGLTHSLDEMEYLPEGADAMLVMAEKTGKLENVLTSAGTHYRDEGTAKMKQLLKLSEPVIIILLGAFVGVVVASVLLPMLDVQSAGIS
ncbi:MAG: type II secretion system F family protein [Aureliella sp.]